MPKISIIVPVYKVEKYLNRCLDSIIAQTFTDWECILIDDGSPDNSGKICDEYAEKDRRFVVIHQENAGVSAARNAGLDVACGEYVTFVDSDDWIEPDMFFCLYDKVKNIDADVVISGYKRNDGIKVYQIEIPTTEFINMPDDFDCYLQGPWGKLFNKSLLNKETIRFPLNIKLAEDLYFTFKVYFGSKKIIAIPEAFYNYYYNCDSVVNNITEEKIDDEKCVLKQIEDILLSNKASKEWFLWLAEKKLLCKNKYLLRLKKPNCILWKSTYPELTQEIIKKSPLMKKIYFYFAKIQCKRICELIYRCRIARGKK